MWPFAFSDGIEGATAGELLLLHRGRGRLLRSISGEGAAHCRGRGETELSVLLVVPSVLLVGREPLLYHRGRGVRLGRGRS